MTFAQANDPMTRIQKEAAEAIETVAGWDSEPTAYGALASRPSGVEIMLTCDMEEMWTCEIGNCHTGKDTTAKGAIKRVFLEYCKDVLAWTADIIGAEREAQRAPQSPRLDWKHKNGAWTIVFRYEHFTVDICSISVDGDDYVSTSPISGSTARGTLPFVWGNHVAHCLETVPSLYLPPCPLEAINLARRSIK